MYLFNTDTVSSLFKPNPSGRLLEKLTQVPREQQHISSITVYEIVYGAYRSDRENHHLGNLRDLLLPAVGVVDFDIRAAFICGALRAQLESAGRPLALADLQVASIAIANELILVTGNSAHFERIPRLRVENWQ